MKYNLSALEIMNLLGYDKPVGKEKLESLEKANHIVLPQIYRSFMEIAHECPLLETADIWNSVDRFYFYYDELDERIADECEEWDDDPESYQENTLYQLSQLPHEEWAKRVKNFLEIGSDFAGGIVNFGISPENMGEQDPPLFWHHEADDYMVWKPDPDGEKLSDFLLDVVLNVLALTEYDTAEDALEEMGWEYTELTLEKPLQDCLQECNIDLNKIKKYGRGNYNDIKLFCCYQENADVFYVGCIGEPGIKDENILYQISRN